MLKQVKTVKEITSGEKNGRKWFLVAVVFEGDDTEYKGFAPFVPTVGKEIDVTFKEEEYKGQMEQRFEIVRKGNGEQLKRIEAKVDSIIKHFNIEETL